MADIRFDIISIGTLSRNRIWKENEVVRSPHATTTLIRAGKKCILVDPALPPQALGARLFERTGLKPDAIDTVFLTNFRPAHRAGLTLFPKARLLIHELEKLWAAEQLAALRDQAPEQDLDRQQIDREIQLLRSFKAADDELAENVDLFPLPGYTPGQCGLLVALPTITVLLAGDGVPTADHFLAGQVLPDSHDIQKAQESLAEVYEIADLIIPGHDNVFLNPRAYGM